MIREDDERLDLIPANLRDAANHPENWDVPGLMRDAADRIEWLERANGEEAGDRIKLRSEFNQHALAAVALYDEIMQIARMTTNKTAANPREAAHLMVGEIARLGRELTQAGAERAYLKDQLEAAITIIKRWQPESHMTREGIRAMVKIMADES